MLRLAPLCLLLGCTNLRGAEDPSDWYDNGTNTWVEEEITWTEDNYSFPEDPTQGIGDLEANSFPVGGSYGKSFAEGDDFPEGACFDFIDDTLPREIEGVVTIHPRFYFKTTGCTTDSEEKYYGSFFIQDGTGGVFVTGDTKVAHFNTGDKVKLLVRGLQTSWDLDMIYTYDVLSVDRSERSVYYQAVAGPLGFEHAGEVVRIAGIVTTDIDTFGSFYVQLDSGDEVLVSLDSEISRRGVSYPVGTRLQVTGPVIYSYNEHQIVVLQKGQLEELE